MPLTQSPTAATFGAQKPSRGEATRPTCAQTLLGRPACEGVAGKLLCCQTEVPPFPSGGREEKITSF